MCFEFRWSDDRWLHACSVAVIYLINCHLWVFLSVFAREWPQEWSRNQVIESGNLTAQTELASDHNPHCNQISLWIVSLANADVSFSGASLFRCFILDLFVYMELSWMLLDGSTVSSWYKARPETLNLLWILMGIIQKRWRFSRQSDPFLEVWSMLQYCGVLLLKVSLLFSKEILPKCNCHIWGNYENSKI